MLVAEELHLDVARPRQPSLEVHRGVAERRIGFRSRSAHGAGQIRRIDDGAHALAAAARHGLDEQRIADRARERARVSRRRCPAGSGSAVPGTTGTPARTAAARAAVLLPISAMASASGR